MNGTTDELEALNKVELYAWLGEDELGSGEIGLKQGLVPAGYIPLVATTRGKIDRSEIERALAHQSQQFRKSIYLCQFRFNGVVKQAVERKGAGSAGSV